MIKLLLLISFSIIINSNAVDFDKTARSLEKELTETNKKLSENRTSTFTEREKISRQITRAKAELNKNQKSDTQLGYEVEKLLEDISELELKIKTNKNSMIDLLQSSIQARRELETISPNFVNTEVKSEFATQDDSLKNKEWLNFFQSYEQVQNKFINDGFKLTVTDTKALSSEGSVKDAKMLHLGHSHSFLLIDGKGGLAGKSKHHTYPTFKAMADSGKQIQSILDGNSGFLQFDFTNGLAIKKQATKKTLSDRFKSGGSIMYPLSFLAMICTLVGIWKTVQLYKIHSQYDDKVQRLVQLIGDGKLEEAKNYVESLQGPVKNLLSEAFDHHKISRDTLEELLNENILSQIPKLDRFMPVLSVSAGAAPLLGLLGTVMGIIKTFEMISLYGTGDPNTMAGGISEALVTTQAGLMVAIPALIWHAILNRRLKAIVGNLEKAMLSFINALSIGKEAK